MVTGRKCFQLSGVTSSALADDRWGVSMADPTRFHGLRVLVTGAGRGIGFSIAEAYLAEGAEVVGVDRDIASCEALERLSTKIRAEQLDIAQLNEESADDLVSRLPEVDIIVHNVGAASSSSFMGANVSAVRETFESNLFGPWLLTRTFVESWSERPHGKSIVFVSSLHAHKIRMVPDYSCSKAAVEMLVSELCVELGPRGIRVNAVEPGAIDTWSDPSRDDHRMHVEASARLVPLRRLGTARDVAFQVLNLSDPVAAAYVTGSVLRVDGGLAHYNWLLQLYGSAAAENARVEELFSDR